MLHVSQPAEAGVAKYVAELARYQAAAGWSVSVACPRGETQLQPLSDRVTAAGASWCRWEATREPGAAIASECRRLRSIVRTIEPDIVHLHSAKAALAGRLVLRGARPTIVQPHAWSFHAASGATARAARVWERFATRWTDAVVCVSASERAEGERVGIRAHYVVIPNGVDLEQLQLLSAADRAAARGRLGIGAAPLAVCIGRLSHQKGQDTLLDVWQRVRADVPDAVVALVGTGPDEEALRARDTPGALFAGATPTPRDWYAAADVIVLPSRWEGMPFVLLEALAHGRSAVAFDVAGVADVLGSGSRQVVRSGDAPALADAVVMRLEDPSLAAAEGVEGRRLVEASHDLEATLSSVQDLYARIVEASEAGARSIA